MSKNMTRKGLAFGAVFALAATGIGSIPANAAGLDDKSFVSLAPNTGTEYSVLNTEYFDLKANAASTIATSGNLKFLVEDTAATMKFDVDVNGTGSADAATDTLQISAVGISSAAAALTASVADTAVLTRTGHGLAVGDTIVISGVTSTDAATFNDTFEVASGSFTVDTFTTIPAIDNDTALTFDATAAVIKRVSSRNSGGTVHTFYETAHGLVDGDFVTLAGFSGASLDNTYEVTVVDANSFSIVTTALTAEVDANDTNTITRVNSTILDTKAKIESFSDTLGYVSLIGSTPSVQTSQWDVPSNGRKSSTDGTFVVDSGVASAANDKVLRLVNINDTTASVNVTAWVDANSNGLIDSTEYTSETRTVQFVKASDLVTAVSLTPVAGDANLTAVITTTPTLNGEQMLAQDPDFLNAAFERQGATNTLYSIDAYDIQDANETAEWNDTTKVFTSTIGMDADSTSVAASDAVGDTGTSWAGLATAETNVDSGITTTSSGAVITVTNTAHGLLVGDKITFDAATAGSDLLDETFTVTSVVSANAFTITAATSTPTIGTDGDLDYIIATWPGSTTESLADRVFPGTYKAQVSLKGTLVGSKATAGAAIVTSSTVTLSTVATDSVQGLSVTTDVENEVVVKKGTTSVDFTAVVTDADKETVSAGRTVRVSLEATTGSGTTQNGTFKINGASAPVTLTTDANGAVSFTLTDATGAATSEVRVTVTAEGTAVAGMDIDWDTQAFKLYDMNTSDGAFASAGGVDVTRTILENGSYQMDLFIADQWYEAAAADKYRVVATGEGVTPGVVAMTNSRGSLTITDNGVERTDNIDTVLTLQELNTDGTVKTSTVTDVETIVAKSTNITLASDASTLYSPTSAAADLSNAVSAKALVERDIRTENTTQPAYGTGFLRLSGQITNDLNATGLEGAAITVSGPSNILFAEGSVEKRGSLTFTSEASGKFEVLLYSTTAQKDTVITFSALGSTATTKVTFTGQGVGEGTSLTIVAPSYVSPASTFQVKAQIADDFGNGVASTTAGSIKVTYTGPGIIFGSLPDKTDVNGALQFSVLLGANDTGDISVVVSYDQNADSDFVDAKDLSATKTVTIGAAPADTKVNAGAFNGYVAVYALGHKGSTISWKIAGKWFKTTVTKDYQVFQRKTVDVGADVNVDIYIDGVKQLSKVVTTR